MHLTALDFIVIVVYMGGLSLLGLYFSKRQTSNEEYLLGGRQIHWLLAGGSVLATLLSTITFLALPGEMIRYGIAFGIGLVALPLAAPVVNRILIPTLLSLPITSMYEYLEKRYEPRVRTLSAAIFCTRTALWMGLVIYTCSFAVSEMTGWGIFATIIVIGAITTFYSTAGGFRTVVWTDNLQLFILLGGALTIPIFTAVHTGTGPAEWWTIFSAAGRTKIEFFSWDFSVRLTVVGVIATQWFWNVCTNGSDQVAVQRYLSTPSADAARRSVWTFTLMNLVLMGLLFFCGLALYAFYFQRAGLPVNAFQEQIAAQADKVMPRFIVQELPPGVSGLLLAALLAAAMSSLSSGINSIAGVMVGDLMGGRGGLRASKIVSVLAGVTGILISCIVTVAMRGATWNLVELTQRVNHIFIGPIAVLFFCGILSRRVGTPAALAGFLVGTLVSLFVAFGKEWFGLTAPISFTWLVPGSFLGGCAAAIGAGWILPSPEPEKVERLLRRAS